MSNETPPLPGETPPVESPPGETPPSPNGETPGGTTPDDVQRELRRLQAGLERANKEAKEYRVKAEELGKFKADADAAKLSETEKLQRHIADLQKERDDAAQQIRTLKINTAVTSAAARLGFADPEDAGRFLSDTALDLDAAGTPTNVEDLLKSLLKAKPYLAGKAVAAPTSGGATNPSRTQSGAPPEITREYIATLTAEEYARLPRETQLRIAQINYDQPWKRR